VSSMRTAIAGSFIRTPLPDCHEDSASGVNANTYEGEACTSNVSRTRNVKRQAELDTFLARTISSRVTSACPRFIPFLRSKT
jgi:hypothetical protein